MEHNCNQCGVVVEDGHPFCPKCHAPQIKVPVRPPTAPVTEPLPPGTPEDLQPPAEPMIKDDRKEFTPPSPEPTYRAQDKLLWRPAISAALIAGLFAAVGTSSGVIWLALLSMFASGGLALTLYRRKARSLPLTPWTGAKIGALAGGWGFVLLSILSASQFFNPGRMAEMHHVMQERMPDIIAANPDPAMHQKLEQFQNYVATDHGLIIISLIGMATLGVFFLVASAFGGALGAALFGQGSDRKQN